MAKVIGGDEINRKLAALAARLSQSRTVRVGFLEGARYPDGTSVAMVAAIQNYGAPRVGIPPRPFMSNMIAAKQSEWPAAISNLLKSTDYNIDETLKLTGEAIKGQIQASIRDTNEPPLAPATVKRKGFDKPLIDTAHMLNSVDYSVE